MLKIRLSMGGAKKRPVYKIVIADIDFHEMDNMLKIRLSMGGAKKKASL